jgi:NTE family protein
MYASGYSPIEIEYFAKSEKFWLMSQGILEQEYQYYIHNSDPNAEVFGFRFAKDSILQKSLPTNLLNTTLLDYEIMSLLGTNP